MLDPSREIDAALLQHRRLFRYLALFSAATNLLMLVPSLYMLQIFDRVLTSRNETTLALLTVLALAFFALGCALEWTRGLITIRVGAALDAALGARVFDAAFARGLRERGANPAQALADLTTLRQLVSGPALFAFLDAPWLPISPSARSPPCGALVRARATASRRSAPRASRRRASARNTGFAQ